MVQMDGRTNGQRTGSTRKESLRTAALWYKSLPCNRRNDHAKKRGSGRVRKVCGGGGCY